MRSSTTWQVHVDDRGSTGTPRWGVQYFDTPDAAQEEMLMTMLHNKEAHMVMLVGPPAGSILAYLVQVTDEIWKYSVGAGGLEVIIPRCCLECMARLNADPMFCTPHETTSCPVHYLMSGK